MDNFWCKQCQSQYPCYISRIFPDRVRQFMDIGKMPFVDQLLPAERTGQIDQQRLS